MNSLKQQAAEGDPVAQYELATALFQKECEERKILFGAKKTGIEIEEESRTNLAKQGETLPTKEVVKTISQERVALLINSAKQGYEPALEEISSYISPSNGNATQKILPIIIDGANRGSRKMQFMLSKYYKEKGDFEEAYARRFIATRMEPFSLGWLDDLPPDYNETAPMIKSMNQVNERIAEISALLPKKTFKPTLQKQCLPPAPNYTKEEIAAKKQKPLPISISDNQDNQLTKLMKGAQEGDPFSQLRLSHLYYCGINVEKDDTKAFEWCSLAANKKPKDPQNKEYDHQRRQYNYCIQRAQLRLGTFYQHGIGVEKDLNAAMKWYQSANKKPKDPQNKEYDHQRRQYNYCIQRAQLRLGTFYQHRIVTGKQIGRAHV